MPTRRSGESNKTAYQHALELLGNRDHAVAELRLKLQRRGYDPEDIEAALARCLELRYLDDSSTALRFARSLMEERRLGHRMVVQRLLQRGFARDVAEAAVAGLDASPDSETARCRSAFTKRFGSGEDLDPKKRERAIRFLLQRGFDWDVVRSVIDVREE